MRDWIPVMNVLMILLLLFMICVLLEYTYPL